MKTVRESCCWNHYTVLECTTLFFKLAFGKLLTSWRWSHSIPREILRIWQVHHHAEPPPWPYTVSVSALASTASWCTFCSTKCLSSSDVQLMRPISHMFDVAIGWTTLPSVRTRLRTGWGHQGHLNESFQHGLTSSNNNVCQSCYGLTTKFLRFKKSCVHCGRIL